MPPGVRVPVREIAEQLEDFVAAIEGVKPVLEKIAAGQATDRDSNPKQNAIVKNLIDKASIKIEIIGMKTGKINLIDVSGIASLARQLTGLLQSFVATIREAATHISHWLAREAPTWVGPIIDPIADGTSRMVKRAAGWIRKQGEREADVIAKPEEAKKTASTPTFDLLGVERMIRSGEVPPAEIVPFVTSFSAQHLDANGMAALGHMTGLRKLIVGRSSGNDLDLSPLAGLLALQSLSVYSSVGDVSPLADLTSLQSLNLSVVETADLTALAQLTDLRSLSLAGSQIKDLSPLAGLSALLFLSLFGQRVHDLSPLASLKALRSLSIAGRHIRDLSPLAGLTALQSLSLAGRRISDLSPLAGLTALRSLILNGVKVSDLSPLTELTALQSLNIDGTQIQDLGPLRHLPNLTIISMPASMASALVNSLGLPGKLDEGPSKAVYHIDRT